MDDANSFHYGTCVLTGDPGCTADTKSVYKDYLYYKLENCKLGKKINIKKL